MLHQKFVMKSLEAEKFKPYEIHRKTSDVSEETCFIQKKMHRNMLISGLTLRA